MIREVLPYAQPRSMSYAEYRDAEPAASTKHDYVRGEVFAMTGGTPEHGALAARIIYLLTRALEGRACRVFSSDVRVRIAATDLATDMATYPDASVVCGQLRTAPDDPHALVNPTLVVEVLSDSTEGYDRGQKASHYRRLPSLRAYLLVSQHEPRLELQLRRDDGTWSLLEVGPGESLPVEPLGLSLAVDDVYVDPLAPSSTEPRSV